MIWLNYEIRDNNASEAIESELGGVYYSQVLSIIISLMK